MYVYVLGYAHRPIWDSFRGSTLHPGRAVLLD